MSRMIKVILWGEEVGRLLWDERRHLSYFTFNPDFQSKGIDIAPLTAPIGGIGSRMPIYGAPERIYQKLPPFIADSLPDDWGNRLFDYWRQEHRIPAAEITPLEKLSFIGSRGMGALEFIPETESYISRGKIDIQSLTALAQKIFSDRENARILPEESLTMQSLIAVGTSAGGRQPKAVVAVSKETGEIRSGQIDGLEGYDYCILKFGDPARSSAELEMSYWRLAVDAGIRMTDSRLMEIEGTKHFLTERFDRENGRKLHIQTLAAMYPDAASYEDMLLVCRKLQLPETDSEEVFRRMVFNILSNNTDDHNKNFSFIMNPHGQWRLAPAYDMTFIFNTGGYQAHEEHCLSAGGKLRDFTKKDILTFAAVNGIRRPASIIDKVAASLSRFRTIATGYGVKQEWIPRIESSIHRHMIECGCMTAPSSKVTFEDTKGNTISYIRIEQAYHGNYHLLADINGHERKYIIRKGTNLYSEISSIGANRLPEDYLRTLAETLLIPKPTNFKS